MISVDFTSKAAHADSVGIVLFVSFQNRVDGLLDTEIITR